MGRGEIERERVAFVASVRPSSFSRRDARACQREKRREERGGGNFFLGGKKGRRQEGRADRNWLSEGRRAVGGQAGRGKNEAELRLFVFFFRAASPLFSLMPLCNR